MPRFLRCPSCDRPLRVRDEYYEKKVCCPQCGHTFLAETDAPLASLPSDVPVSVPPAVLEEPVRKVESPRVPMARCRGCREPLHSRFVRCPFCGELLEEPERETPLMPFLRRDCEPHRGDFLFTLGTISVVVASFGFFPLGLPLGVAVLGDEPARFEEDGARRDGHPRLQLHQDGGFLRLHRHGPE